MDEEPQELTWKQARKLSGELDEADERLRQLYKDDPDDEGYYEDYYKAAVYALNIAFQVIDEMTFECEFHRFPELIKRAQNMRDEASYRVGYYHEKLNW